MAVTNQIPRNVSTAASGATVFPYDFKIVDAGDLLVTVDGAAKTLGVHYTVDGVGLDAGGNITFLAPMAGGETVMRKRNMVLARSTDFQNLGDLRASTLNNDQDAAVLMVQQIAEQQDRALTLPPESTASGALPLPAPLKPLVWNAAGDALENGDTTLTGDLLLRPNLAAGTDALFAQPGAGAAARGIVRKLREVELSIADFADDPAALVAGVEAADTAWARAQAALPLTGGTIAFPDGVFRFTQTMVVGNAPALGPSTLNGVRVRGRGWGRSAATMLTNSAATRLVWDGAVGGTLLRIQGPISGVCVEDLMLDGAGKAATLIESQRSFHQSIRRVLGVAWANGFGLVVNANSPLGPTYGGAAPISHVYEQFDLQSPGVGASAVDIANGSGNINQLLFHRCYLDRYNSPSTIGLRLGYCDHLQFTACHLAQTGALGDTGIAVQVRPQPGQGDFPWNITFTGTSMAGGVAYDASLQAWTNATYPALIFQPCYTADGAPVPPKSANGGADLPAGLCRGWTDNGIAFGWAPEAQEVVNAAATIAPRAGAIILAGAGVTVSNITPPRLVGSVPVGGYRLTIIPSGAGLKLGSGGNIAEALDLTNYRAVSLVYSEGTGKWHVQLAGEVTSSGTYTPAATNVSNVAASTPREFTYLRVGNTVQVVGRIEVTPTAAGSTTVEITLPIPPATFGQTWEACGTAVNAEATYTPGLVIASTTSARIAFQATTTAARGVLVNFAYQLS